MFKNKTVILILIFLSLMFGLIGGTSVYANANNPDVTWIYADYRPAVGVDSIFIKEDLFKLIDERYDGKFTVQQHWGGELAQTKEILPTVGEGIADIGYLSGVYYTGELPYAYVPWLPFLSTPRIDTTMLAMNELYTKQYMIDELASQNIVYGGTLLPDFYNILSMKPIRVAEDLKGTKARATSYQGQILAKFGASPISVTPPEIYGAMQTGLVDTHVHTIDSFVKYGTIELAKYFTWGMDISAVAPILAINKDTWENAPSGLKEAYRSVLEDLPILYRAANRGSYFIGEIEAIKENGIEFIKFPIEEKKKLASKAKSVWEDWAKRTPDPEFAMEVIDDYQELLEKYDNMYPEGLPAVEEYPCIDKQILLKLYTN